MNNVKIANQVTDLEMQKYTDLIYQRTGIRIPMKKTTLLSNRVRRRLKKTGVDSFGDYFRLINSLPLQDPEWDAFLQEITTHETYLFRDELQWDWFRNDYLREIATQARNGKRSRRLRIWSAAASTGDEAYTIACCIANDLIGLARWKIEILGTDIGIGALEHARAAVYGERAMRLVPENIKKSWFKQVPDAQLWNPKPALTKMVSFRQHNLLDTLNESPFDLIFLKNVLIYFDPTSKQRAADNVLQLLAPGGALVAGAAEGVSNILTDMKHLQPWLFVHP